jgi:hypothetical protein
MPSTVGPAIVEPTKAVERGWIVARDAVDAVESRWRTELGERRFWDG